MATTIIFTHGGGRFGNQLIQFGHLIAMVEEQRDFSLINMSFWPYSGLCAGTHANPVCFYSPTGQTPPRWGQLVARSVERMISCLPARIESSARFRFPKLVHKLANSRSVDLEDTWGGVEVTWLGGLRELHPPRPNPHTEETFDLSNAALHARLRRPGSIFLAGWPFRDWNAFERQADKVRQFLGLAPVPMEKAKNFIAGLRLRHKTLVGVLMRQQDYRIWSNGRYFFSSPQYRTWMQQAAKVFGPDCGLVVACDETQPNGLLEGLNATWCTGAAVGPGHFVESMAELSLCDVILSPPSTFAGWAAFLGKVPLLPLLHSAQIIQRADVIARNPFHLIEARSKAMSTC